MSNKQLLPSLISSFVTDGVLGTDEALALKRMEVYRTENYQNPPEQIAADLYLFMEPDAKQWVAKLGGSANGNEVGDTNPSFNVLEQLKPEYRQKAIDGISSYCDKVKTKPIAVTSFLPQISQPRESKFDAVDEALTALMCMSLSLAERFNRRPTLQLVAGSMIEKFRLKEPTDAHDGKYIIENGDFDKACDLVFQRIADCLERIELDNKSELRIAFEQEPGPLFLVQDAKTIEDFVSKINSCEHKIIRDCVGLNLDIAHWWLSPDISIEWYKSNPAIRECVFHSHISGHSHRGHFGDKSLKDVKDPLVEREFKEWLKLLRDESPNLSGYVSVEHEAAKDPRSVVASVQTLINWLGEI